MQETEQFNIRLSKSLLYDLDFIERVGKVPKNSWVKYKLAEAIRVSKDELLTSIEDEYIKSRISAIDFKELIGVEPSKSLKEQRTAHHKHAIAITSNQTNREAAREALLSDFNKSQKSEFFDETNTLEHIYNAEMKKSDKK